MKFSNQQTLQAWSNKRKRKGLILLIATLLCSLAVAYFIYMVSTSSTLIMGFLIMIPAVLLVVALVLFSFTIAYFSNNSKYGFDKLIKNSSNTVPVEEYEEEFKRADQITPTLWMSKKYLFSQNRNTQIVILSIKDIIWVYQGSKGALGSSAGKVATTLLIGNVPDAINELVVVLKDKAVVVLNLGRIKIKDRVEIEDRISKELKLRNEGILLGYNDEYRKLYRSDFNALVNRATKLEEKRE